MLVSYGIDKIMFWNLNNYILNFEIDNTYCPFYPDLNKIDEDRIIEEEKSECNKSYFNI